MYNTINREAWKKAESKLPFLQWRAIQQFSNQWIVQQILSQPEGFCLPARMGLLLVVKNTSYNSNFIDLKHFAQTGEKIPRLNMHTFGYHWKAKWEFQFSTRFSLRKLFQFKAVRSFNRAITPAINRVDFLEDHKYCNLC